MEYDDFLHQKNVNLFEEEELKVRAFLIAFLARNCLLTKKNILKKNEDDKNEEAELEKKEEKEKFEKKIGLLKYLVDDEMLDLKSWFKIN